MDSIKLLVILILLKKYILFCLLFLSFAILWIDKLWKCTQLKRTTICRDMEDDNGKAVSKSIAMKEGKGSHSYFQNTSI